MELYKYPIISKLSNGSRKSILMWIEHESSQHEDLYVNKIPFFFIFLLKISIIMSKEEGFLIKSS